MWLGEVGELGEEGLVVRERVRRRLRHDRRLVPQRLVVQHLDVVRLAVQRRVHVEEQRQEARRDLVLEPPAERPRPGRVHVDRADVRHEHVDRAPQRDVQALRVPRVVRHAELLEQRLLHAREGLDRERVRPVHGDRRVVVVERRLQAEGRDRRAEAPAQVAEALDEVGARARSCSRRAGGCPRAR